ncbi:MAG: sigma-70 family polymerase sigma factor [Ramlibacter sp.]|jgi:RNA polymerase sigma factor for flagellar operon FliA|nr:sigma-70 family polymerase sigma factor [Ramlibacter sp.]
MGGQADVAEASLWELWRSHADASARERLLELHMPYARIVAASYYSKRFHDEIEFADYLQLASLGLIEALDRFDPAVGVQFRTFAARRMHGALLDGIERLTEKQQQIAARQRLEKQRRAALKEAAMADTVNSAAGNGSQVLRYVAEAGLAFALAWILDGTGMLDDGEKTEIIPFYRSTELRELRQRIVDLVNALPAQERCVLQRHYFQEVPFHEIAVMLGVTKGRISQIHRKALGRLKDELRGQQDCDVAW